MLCNIVGDGGDGENCVDLLNTYHTAEQLIWSILYFFFINVLNKSTFSC